MPGKPRQSHESREIEKRESMEIKNPVASNRVDQEVKMIYKMIKVLLGTLY
jgi:hypothetical protein